MEVSEKKAKIWRTEKQGVNGVWYRYSVAISTKTIDGDRKTVYMPIRFSKKADAPDPIPNGATCNFSGFMSVDWFDTKNGEEVKRPQIVVMKAEFSDLDEEDGFSQADDDIPF